MEKSKKAIVYQNILTFGEKVAKLPRREIVESQHWEYENQKNCQTAVRSPEKYAFEKMETQRILLVENACELDKNCQTI